MSLADRILMRNQTGIPEFFKEAKRAREDPGTPPPFEKTVEEMSLADIYNQLYLYNKTLGDLGVKTSVSDIIRRARQDGSRYEDRVSPEGGTRPTPMNCFMALLDAEPRLLQQLSPENLKRLGATVSRLGMVFEAFVSKTEGRALPEPYDNPPPRLNLNRRRP